MTSGIERAPFGSLPDGAIVERVTLHGSGGFAVQIITLGAAVQAILVPDRAGAVADVVLGHDALSGYLAHRDFFGATIGRYANRIAKGKFDLAGQAIAIAPNDGPNALHGGAHGFDTRLWTIEETQEGEEPRVTLSRTSPDGEEGFPGTLKVRVTYRIVGGSALSVDLEATSDRDTVVNLTNHSYFNLSGVDRLAPIFDHRLRVAADEFLPVDKTSIPTGERRAVDGTPFDFREPRAIGERIREAAKQLSIGLGYDHNYCLFGGRADEPRLAAEVEDPESGRRLRLFTDEAGLQFYSGNQLTGARPGKYGLSPRQSDAFCLEPQAFPDSPNRPDFPSVRLQPGETYRHRIRYEFGAA